MGSLVSGQGGQEIERKRKEAEGRLGDKTWESLQRVFHKLGIVPSKYKG